MHKMNIKQYFHLNKTVFITQCICMFRIFAVLKVKTFALHLLLITKLKNIRHYTSHK